MHTPQQLTELALQRQQRRELQQKNMRKRSSAPLYASVWLSLLNEIKQQQMKHS